MDHVQGFHDLLARARAADGATTDQLLALVRPWLEQVARDHAPDGQASDLVQEAWLRAWQKLDQFHGAADEAQALMMFRTWLARIVTRLGLNAVRDGHARQRTAPGRLLRLDGCGSASGDSAAAPEPPADEPTPSARVQTAEQARLVQEALARLTDPFDQDIVRLRFYEGLSLRQVAARLGCNPETVRQRYHALLHRLQRDLHGLL